MSDELMNRAREADTIAALLAANERLRLDKSVLTHTYNQLFDAAAELSARAAAAESREAVLSAAEVKIDGHRFACSQAVADHVARLDADLVSAETRLRELASAEPVRYEYEWFDPVLGRYDVNWGELRPRHGQTMEQKVAEIESYQRIDGSGQMYRVRALIRRPEMPS